MLGCFQNNAIVSQFSFGYADELTQSQLHLMKQTRSYIQRTVYVSNEAINNLHQKKIKINHSQKHSCAVLATTSPKFSTSLSRGMSTRGFETGQKHSLGKVHLQKLYFHTETRLLRYFPPAVTKGCGSDGCVGCSCDGFSPCGTQLCQLCTAV